MRQLASPPAVYHYSDESRCLFHSKSRQLVSRRLYIITQMNQDFSFTASRVSWRLRQLCKIIQMNQDFSFTASRVSWRPRRLCKIIQIDRG